MLRNLYFYLIRIDVWLLIYCRVSVSWPVSTTPTRTGPRRQRRSSWSCRRRTTRSKGIGLIHFRISLYRIFRLKYFQAPCAISIYFYLHLYCQPETYISQKCRKKEELKYKLYLRDINPLLQSCQPGRVRPIQNGRSQPGSRQPEPEPAIPRETV